MLLTLTVRQRMPANYRRHYTQRSYNGPLGAVSALGPRNVPNALRICEPQLLGTNRQIYCTNVCLLRTLL